MIYFYLILGAFVSFPFVFISAGFIYSLTKTGEEGIVWRLNIGLAFDRLCAACLGYPDKMTICGFVGRRASASNNFTWKVYVKIIEFLPWFAKGHCAETAEKEKHFY